ncbi:DUF4421 family protein [Yeosuana sp. MJ-SS3]|jgi:hypothetical protein|uniref:DUF4421 family protein n=1 Tax=Gilvirhabdus luticola TaxID=3079858 RepID=A0ABU3U624_9FLAO|nr:DUF4421 family protein [Yeosuana sp. MJ-SS3]MDU8885777.1 DUF4421 family protein [Yeosuana sp. MJ-SS3]
MSQKRRHFEMNWFPKHLLLYVFLISVNFYGQNATQKDSTSIVSFADKIIIKANLSTQTDTYILRTDNTVDLKVEPNNNYKLFLSLDYQFIGISLGFAPNFITDNQDDNLKGKSSFSDLQFRMFLGNWVQGIYYNKIKGYYIKNTHDFVDDWIKGEDPYIQIPNLKNVTWGMSTAYVFNPKFSYRNLVYQTEWQKKSAGSFVPILYYNYNNSGFTFLGSESEEKSFNIRLATNYYYTLVIKENWFISPYVSPSLGVRFVNDKSIINDIKSTEYKTLITRQLEGGLQLGFSSKRIIFGGSYNFSANWYNEDKNSNTENDRIYGILYFGYRFDTPKFIENSYNWLTNKF